MHNLTTQPASDPQDTGLNVSHYLTLEPRSYAQAVADRAALKAKRDAAAARQGN